MKRSFKCENCGASLMVSDREPIQFCSYCGAAIQRAETAVDLERVRAEHAQTMHMMDSYDKERETKQDHKEIIIGLIILLLVLGVMCWFAFVPKAMDDKRLDAQVTKVQQLILNGNYDEALIEAQSIRVQKEGLIDDRYNRWENQRKDLIKLIEQKKKESGK